jgi:fructose-bisphosphate aldolase, class I
MSKQELATVAKAMVAPAKGLLAMDESNRTCNKRFADVGSRQTKKIAVLTES